jgi:hypothetical protein
MTTGFTLIEPNVDESKFYPPGVGLIVEVDVETGDPAELAEFTSSFMRSASRNQMTQIRGFV